MSARRNSPISEAVRHVMLAVTSIFVLLPFIWMISLSIKSPGEVFQATTTLLPRTFYGVENYSAVLTRTMLPRFMLNGFFVGSAVIILQLLIAAPCAYALAKLEFKGSSLLLGMVLISLLIPQEVLGLPLFIIFYFWGLLDSYTALVLPFIISPFAIFLLRQFFKSVPDDLIHAARLDGFSELSIIWRIMVPAALPAILVFVLLSFISRWNNLFWPSIAIQNQELMPPSLGIVMFRDAERGDEYGPLMAAATLVVAPLVLAFLVAQRRFIEGITMTGMK